ncbi:uncharacterized protein G2W53_022587 [Senna tora]|uniref:Uncharacterized protein n=1 Tax=Senna tora TaxID=362788 RepID=A0A834TLF6_9FABA|nr:uncharacterized protein G2W53_022587 [Senna tora]
MSSLQAHEVRLLMSHGKSDEKAFQAKADLTKRKTMLGVVVVKVVIVAVAMEEAEAEENLMMRIRTKPLCDIIAKNQATKNLIVGKSRRMRKVKQALQRRLMQKFISQSA